MKNAALLVVFPSIDARSKKDMTNVKVFMGFSGANKLALEDFDSKVIRGAVFFDTEEFREATNSVEQILGAENIKNKTSRCCAGLKLEVGEAVIWHEAEEYLNENN